MRNFEKGCPVYGPDGSSLTFDHEVDGFAYCYPIIIVQTTNQRGDDFEEHEVEADHLIAIPIGDLSKTAPRKKLDGEISCLQETRDGLIKNITALRSDEFATQRNLRDTERAAERYDKSHPVFREITRLIEGGAICSLLVYPQSSTSYKYAPPKRSTEPEVFLTLARTNQGKFEWVGGLNSQWNRDIRRVVFFDTEKELEKFVREAFTHLLDAFYVNPVFERLSHSVATFNTIKEWVSLHPFLGIPQTVLHINTKHLAEEHNKKVTKAEAELKKLMRETD